MTEYEAAEWADMYTREIYDHEEIWSEYIDVEDEDDEDEN